MAFNGSGVWSALKTLVAGQTITAAEHNAEWANIKGALELARLRDGQNNPSADLPMASARHTGCNDATARTNYATAADIQDAKLTYIAASGTNTVTATLAPAISAYVTGAPIWLKQATTNTGAMTINLNSVAAKALKKQNDVAMSAGDIEGGQVYCITYDGTDFQMQSQTATTTNDATLNSIAALGASGKMLYTTGTDTWAESTITSAGRALLDDAAASNQRTTLGLVIGTNVQAFDAQLTDVAGLAVTNGGIIVGDGSNFVLESGATARASLGVPFSTSYTSSETSVTADTLHTFAHSLGAFPLLVRVVLKCSDAGGDDGYADNDEVDLTGIFPTADAGAAISVDATNVFVAVGTAISLIGKASFDNETITLSKWKLLVRAWV
jgi:hypothetical protein